MVKKLEKSIKEYRALLLAAEQKSQESYDKTVLTLSGGALGVSFAFVKDFIGDDKIVSPELLVFAWICWAVSVTCILASFFTSQYALRKAIIQIDTGEIYKRRPGGIVNVITVILNVLGGVLFLAGVIIIVFFVFSNMR